MSASSHQSSTDAPPTTCDVRRYVNNSRRSSGKSSTATTDAPKSVNNFEQYAPAIPCVASRTRSPS